MKTFGDKQFKNELDSLEANYDYILTCEINPCSSSCQGVEENLKKKSLNLNLIVHLMKKNRHFK